MEKIYDHMQSDERNDEIVVLGVASVETQGAGGIGEQYGRLVLPGIEED